LQGGLAHLAQTGQILRLKNRPATDQSAPLLSWTLRGRKKPLGLKTELELRFANRLMSVLIRFRIENGNSG
jgi:hypothetical protein